jgi:hypothetical protein
MSENMAEYYCEKCKRIHKPLYRGKPSKVYKEHLPIDPSPPNTPDTPFGNGTTGAIASHHSRMRGKDSKGHGTGDGQSKRKKNHKSGGLRTKEDLVKGLKVIGPGHHPDPEMMLKKLKGDGHETKHSSPPITTVVDRSTSKSYKGSIPELVDATDGDRPDGDGKGEAASGFFIKHSPLHDPFTIHRPDGTVIPMSSEKKREIWDKAVRNVSEITCQIKDLQEGVDGDGPPVEHIPDAVEQKQTWRQRLKNWWRGQ